MDISSLHHKDDRTNSKLKADEPRASRQPFVHSAVGITSVHASLSADFKSHADFKDVERETAECQHVLLLWCLTTTHPAKLRAEPCVLTGGAQQRIKEGTDKAKNKTQGNEAEVKIAAMLHLIQPTNKEPLLPLGLQ